MGDKLKGPLKALEHQGPFDIEEFKELPQYRVPHMYIYIYNYIHSSLNIESLLCREESASAKSKWKNLYLKDPKHKELYLKIENICIWKYLSIYIDLYSEDPIYKYLSKMFRLNIQLLSNPFECKSVWLKNVHGLMMFGNVNIRVLWNIPSYMFLCTSYVLSVCNSLRSRWDS